MKPYAANVEKAMKALPKSVFDPSIERKRGRPPTSAQSDFIQHRAQGDWAERMLLRALDEQVPDLTPIQYGRIDSLVAGEPGFREFYEEYQDELESIGKRPDLLLTKAKGIPRGSLFDDLTSNQKKLAISEAVAGIEVRSSAYLVEKARKYREERGEELTLSFTPKVEDLALVNQWIQEFNIPHYYFQVFFDEIYGISFEEIVQLASKVPNRQISVAKDARNQFKSTVKVALGAGTKVGEVQTLPSLGTSRTIFATGRVVATAIPIGGDLRILNGSLRKLLE